MQLTTLLCATLVLFGIQSCKMCNDFWKRWQIDSCGLRELCLSGISGYVRQSWKQNLLDCNGQAPDKDIFRCGNISHQITSFITKNCKFSNFDMKSILHGRDPAVLYFDYTTNQIIPIEVKFSKMESLEMVFLKGSRTGGLFQITFDIPNKIQVLEIDNHDYNRFVGSPFVNLIGLIRMDITKGKVNRLTNNLLLGLERLKELSLFSNQIAQIESLAFKDLLSLTYLDLSENRLSTILDSTFDPLIRLEELDLSHNPLQQLPQNLPFGSSRTLSIITIANGSLGEFPKINWREHNLVSVDLTGNNITKVVLPVYTKNRTSVNLNNNNIKTIELDFNRISGVSPVYLLFYNEPICDCRLESFLEFLHSNLQKSHVLFPGMDVVTCAAPNSTRALADVWPEYISCRLTGCPPLCLCSKLTRNTVQVNCSSRGLFQVPTTLPSTTVTVYLRNNYIDDLSTVDSPSWHTVTNLYITNNKVKTLRGWKIPSNLTVLAIDENDLTDLPKSIMEAVERNEHFRIYLANNDWSCNCTSIAIIAWMQKNKKKIVDYGNVTCKRVDNGQWIIDNVNSFNLKESCPELFTSTFPSTTVNITVTTEVDNVLICSLVSVFVVLLLCLLFCLLLHRRSLLAKLYGRRFRTSELDESKGFDVFVCYTDTDRRAANEIVSKLEPEFRVYLHDRSLLSSDESAKRIIYSMRKTKAIILLISQSFLQSKWFQTEFRKIYRKIPDKCKRRMIPIFFEDVTNESFLPYGFRQLWYLKCRLRWEENFFWEKLTYFLKD